LKGKKSEVKENENKGEGLFFVDFKFSKYKTTF